MQTASRHRPAFQIYAAAVLVLNLAVILWGALVRATGSGAGCGEHWPLCNGVVVPQAPAIATMIEFTHRVTSGLSLIAVLGLFVWSRRLPRKHPARTASAFALLFEVMEAIIGAGLVLLGQVGVNPSVARGYSLSIHLVNTLFLLAALTIAVWAGGGSGFSWNAKSGGRAWFALCALGLLLLGISGAIAALGDTLFRTASLSAGFHQDFAAGVHPFIRLRVWHPVIAIAVAVCTGLLCFMAIRKQHSEGSVRAAWALAGIIVVQLAVGMINLGLLAPVPLQLIHLFFADALWIAFVVLAAEWFVAAPASETRPLPEFAERA